MAEPVEDYTPPRASTGPTPGKARYPWKEWLDGRWWRLVQGEDFYVGLKTMDVNIRGAVHRANARRLKEGSAPLKAEVHAVVEGDTRILMVRAYVKAY